MPEEPQTRTLQALFAYVSGDSSEPLLVGATRGVPRDELHRLLDRHRRELESIDPARSVILESLI